MLTRTVVLILAATGLAIAPMAALAQDDPSRGKVLFQQCRVCHSVDVGAPSQMGPNLNKVVGRTIANVKGFSYSPAMAKQRGTWTRERLDVYLTAPARALPGNRMAYGGMPNPADRRNVIAYLAAVK